MAQDPREAFRKIQQTFQNASRGTGMGGGPPKGSVGAGIALLLLSGGVYLVNNALFNGILVPKHFLVNHTDLFTQLTVVTAP